MWNTFWETIDEGTTLVAFEDNAWSICYAYCAKSYLYTGYDVDRTRNSGSWLDFLKRFAGKKTRVFIKDKQFLVERIGIIRQIPIKSLNQTHTKTNEFPIDSQTFDYYLSREQLDQVSFVCANPEFYELFQCGPEFYELFQYKVDVHDSEDQLS